MIAAIAFGVGVYFSGGSDDRDSVDRFAAAWAAGDYAAMYAELSPEAQTEFADQEFVEAYEEAMEVSTLTAIEVGESRGPIDHNGEQQVAVPIEYTTRSFGVVSGELGVPVSDGMVAWSPRLVFPGLEDGEELDRKTTAPKRAPIVAADGSALAEGPASARTTVGAGGILTGEIGEPPTERAREMKRQGFADGTPAGTNGLELAFDGKLAGTPGGKLLAKGGSETRVLAQAKPIPGKPLKTTIDPDLQQAAATALGDLFGGVAVLDADNGDVKALAGIAFSAPQPPGSVMKIITVGAGLTEGITSLDTDYPVVTSEIVDGREIENAHGETCGGDLTTSFAKSCNTVFAPMGAELGPERLIKEAETYGFNSPPTLYNDEALAATQPASSTIPDPLASDLDTGVSAIGQGQVLATPLQIASVAQTIANDGTRSPTSIVKNPDLQSSFEGAEVLSPEIADDIKGMMVEVVNSGTGQAAKLPNTTVAGKTGTAELGPSVDQVVDPTDPDAEVELDVDAWFAAFAPAKNPKLAVAVMIVNADGDGGVVAAPIAARVLAAGL